LEIIACSYSASLAEEFSREVREQIEDPEFQVVFPKAVMNKDKRNITGWKTTKGGGFLPAGVGGPITGKGADILIIDDPIKNAEEAESETTRETIWKWYTSTAYTRLAPGGGILVIQTRWHDDDLSGRLESAMDAGEGDEYRIIRYPAEALRNEKYRRTGQALHKERYPEAALAKIKRAVGPRTWEALYQQNPTPDEGMFFNNEMFRYYGKDHPRPPDEELVFYTAWDLAIGKKEQNDYTVGATWGMDMNGDLWIVDMRRGRWDAHEISTEICDNYERWGSQIVGVEKGQISLAIGPYLEELIDERGLNALYIEELPPGKRDKIARARTTQGLMRRGRVWFPTADTCVWVNEMVFEMKRFPNGTNDDIVDAIAWLGLLLPQTTGPNAGSPSIQVSGWRARLKGIVDSGRKRSAMSA
jgi:predicted phage terminase large subunit-like protein